MPISATAFPTVVVLEIVSGKDFQECLKLIHSIPEADRKFDDLRKTWTISHPDNYQYIPAIKNALATGPNANELVTHQLSLGL